MDQWILEGEKTPKQIEPQAEESTLGWLGKQALRHEARTVARGYEALRGTAGNVLSLPFAAGSYLTGGAIPDYESLRQKNVVTQNILPPTSEDIRREQTQALTGQALEPQNPTEQFTDQLTQDFVSAINPFGKGSAVKAIGKAALQAGAGNLADWATTTLGGSEKAGKYAKFGTMLLTGMAGSRGELESVKNNAYKAGMAALPEHAVINVAPEADLFNKIYNSVSKSDHPLRNEMMERIQAFFRNASGIGKDMNAKVSDLIDLKQSWNRWLQDPKLNKDLRSQITRMVGATNEAISRYGATNPEFFTPYLVGEELTKGLYSQGVLQKLVTNNKSVQKVIESPITKSIVGLGSSIGAVGGTIVKGIASIPSTAAGLAIAGGVGYGVKEAARAAQLISTSPVARRYYKNALLASISNNSRAVAQNLNKLDKVAQKFGEKNSEVEPEWVLSD